MSGRGIIDTPETTTNESVSTEYEALTLCRFERPELTHSRCKAGCATAWIGSSLTLLRYPRQGVATVDLRYEMTPRTITDIVIGLVADGDLTTLGLSLAGGMFVSRPTRLMIPYYAAHDEITSGGVCSPATRLVEYERP